MKVEKLTTSRQQSQVYIREVVANYDYLVLEWGTGTGKTKTALDCAEKLKAKNILIVTGEKAHKKNWEDEKAKWEFRGNTTYVC